MKNYLIFAILSFILFRCVDAKNAQKYADFERGDLNDLNTAKRYKKVPIVLKRSFIVFKTLTPLFSKIFNFKK